MSVTITLPYRSAVAPPRMSNLAFPAGPPLPEDPYAVNPADLDLKDPLMPTAAETWPQQQGDAEE